MTTHMTPSLPQQDTNPPSGRPGALDYELTVMLSGYGVYFDPIKHTAYMRLLEEFELRVGCAALRVAARGWERRPAHAPEVANLARQIVKYGPRAVEHGMLHWKGSSAPEQVQRACGSPPLDAIESLAIQFAARQKEQAGRLLAAKNPAPEADENLPELSETAAQREACLTAIAKLFGGVKSTEPNPQQPPRRPKTAAEIEAGLAALEAEQHAEGAQSP